MKDLFEEEEEDFKNSCVATGLIIGSFCFSLTWYFFLNSGIYYTHPSVYMENGAIERMSYPIHQFFTFLSEIVNVVLLLIAKDFAPRMRFGRWGDMWYYLYALYCYNILDFVLAYRTTPYRHIIYIMFLIMMVFYLIHKYKNIYK